MTFENIKQIFDYLKWNLDSIDRITKYTYPDSEDRYCIEFTLNNKLYNIWFNKKNSFWIYYPSYTNSKIELNNLELSQVVVYFEELKELVCKSEEDKFLNLINN